MWGQASRRWRVHHLALGLGLLVVLFCAAFLFYLVSSASLDKNHGQWVRIIVFVSGLCVGIGTIIASGEAPTRRDGWNAWIAPKPIAILLVGVYTAFGTMAGLLPLIAPQPARESYPGALENEIANIAPRVAASISSANNRAPSTIRTKIAGGWGEGSCAAVSYWFTLHDQALLIDSAHRPRNTHAYHFVGTVQSEKDQAMEVRGEAPDGARGLSSTFTLESNGMTERLVWQDHTLNGTSVELNRCGPG